MTLDEKKLRRRYEKIIRADFEVLYPNQSLSTLPYKPLELIANGTLSLTDAVVRERLCGERTASLHLSVFLEYPFITKYWGLAPSQIDTHQAEMLVAGQDIYSVLGQPKNLGPLEKLRLNELLQNKRKRTNHSRKRDFSLRQVSTKRGLRDPAQGGRTYGGPGGGEGR